MTTLHNDTRRPLRLPALAMALAMAISLVACGKGEAKDEPAAEGGQYSEQAAGEKEEGHSESEELTLTAEEAERAGIKVEEIRPGVRPCSCRAS